MRHALFLPIFGELAEPRVVADISAVAESNGWDGVFVWDHMAYRAPVVDIADPWITMAAIGMATERVCVGPMVTPIPRRRPWKLAREVATLDRLTRGRFILGVGIGGDPGRELSALGEELDPVARGRLLDEGLEVLEALWSGEEVEHHGAAYVVDKLRFGPPPWQRPRPPIWVAGRWPNRAPLRRAARYEGYFPINLESPDQLALLVDDLRAARAALGRDGTGDVVVSGPAGADPAPWAAAGATWWLTGFPPFEVTEAAVRAVASSSPPLR